MCAVLEPWLLQQTQLNQVLFVMCITTFCDVRFKDYDGPLLQEFIFMRNQVPEVFYNALLKDNISMTDILKINCAIKKLSK